MHPFHDQLLLTLLAHPVTMPVGSADMGPYMASHGRGAVLSETALRPFPESSSEAFSYDMELFGKFDIPIGFLLLLCLTALHLGSYIVPDIRLVRAQIQNHLQGQDIQ